CRGDELALSPDGAWVAVRNINGLVLGGLKQGSIALEELSTLGGSDSAGLAFTPDSQALLAGVGTEFYRVEVSSGESGRIARFSKRETQAVAVAPDGRLLLLAAGPPTAPDQRGPRSASSLVWLWDVPAKKKVAELPSHASEVLALAFSPDGKFAVAAGRDRV